MVIMLSSWDDFAIHSSPMPILEHADAEQNRYERYFLTCYEKDSSFRFAIVINVHAVIGLADAAVSVTRGGVQTSIQAASELTDDRVSITAGPVLHRVSDPMRRIEVEVNSHGLSAQLTFDALSRPVREARMMRMRSGRTIQDRTRYCQVGTVTGAVMLDGDTWKSAPEGWDSVRDHSWGYWDAPKWHASDQKASSVYFVWTVLRFDDEVVQAVVHEDEFGDPFGACAAVSPLDGYRSEDLEPIESQLDSSVLGFDVDHRPGQRWLSRARLTIGPRGKVHRAIDIEPIGTSLARGVGYGSPGWTSGSPDTLGRARRLDWSLEEVDPAAAENLYTQQVVRAIRSDGAIGYGVIDHRVSGRHDPSNLH